MTTTSTQSLDLEKTLFQPNPYTSLEILPLSVSESEMLSSRIYAKIQGATRILKQLGYESENISPKEFYDYMTGETPTGGVITLNDVLRDEFLTVHEVVEISELKKKGIPIDKQTVMVFYPEVYEAHFTAMDYELTHALTKRDYGRIKRRLTDAEGQLGDPYLPQEFKYLRQELAPRWRQ